jgi:tetratricopeptide (TPR) repeat protein
MLHVIREYAMTCLLGFGEDQALHRRHLEVYTRLIEGIAPRFLGTDRKRWLDFGEAEHDNMRAALEWAQDNAEVDLALRLCAAAWRFWQARGHLHEARRKVEAALGLPGGELIHRAKAKEALGGILWWQGNMSECLRVYEEALAMQRELGDPREIANALYNHGLARAFTAGRESDDVTIEEVESLFDEAEQLFSELGDLDGLGNVEWGRGSAVAYIAGQPEQALGHMKKAIDYYSQAGNDFGMGWGLFEVGIISFRLEREQEAWEYLQRGLTLFRGHRDISAAVLFIASIAAVAEVFGDMQRTARLTGAYHTLQITSGTDIVDYETNQLTAGLKPEMLENMTGELADAYQEGRAMDLDTAIAYALAGPTDEAAAAQRVQ